MKALHPGEVVAEGADAILVEIQIGELQIKYKFRIIENRSKKAMSNLTALISPMLEGMSVIWLFDKSRSSTL